ncbi:CAP domain-containing protein [Niallia sp. XMNu-256]|uniref:CAP domain-containing protein n=1 Tax=Niallia sp. XMNu-256 TaxID=3082444 RepID=UPI0030D15ECD
MRGLRRLLLLLLTLGIVWIIFDDDIKSSPYYLTYQSLTADLKAWKEENPDVQAAINHLELGLDEILSSVLGAFQKEETDQIKLVDRPELNVPDSHSFSVHNIELGDSREKVENLVGTPKRSNLNEYGVDWHAYHDQYQNFFMIAYDEESKVAGLYTNQDLLTSKQEITLGSSKDQVVAALGEPLTSIQKDWVSYQIQNNGEFHLYKLDNSYVTIFFDKHEGNMVTAIQIISEELENQKKEYYAEGNHALKEGFEFQLFDLTNAARVVHGLQPLTWDDHVKITAREHSTDMAVNQYFSHTNLDGQSPFDRMAEDNITFRVAGENLAAGQLSSIFAHEGLMNSLGHRENILQTEFQSLGIGVAFDIEKKPYYTQKFLARN